MKRLHKGELAVGLGPYAAELLVPRALPRFVSAHPAVRIRIQVDSLEVPGRALRQRALDVVVGESFILEGDESIAIVEQLDPIGLYLFGRAGHPLLGRHASVRDVLRFPLVQVSRLPPRALKPLLGALGPASSDALSLPVPAIDCPTVPLAIATILGSDALMPASLGMVQRELALGTVVPVIHEPWMRTAWAIIQLRHRTPSPAVTAFLAALRVAQADCLGGDAKLEKRWRAKLPKPAGARPARGKQAGAGAAA